MGAATTITVDRAAGIEVKPALVRAVLKFGQTQVVRVEKLHERLVRLYR